VFQHPTKLDQFRLIVVKRRPRATSLEAKRRPHGKAGDAVPYRWVLGPDKPRLKGPIKILVECPVEQEVLTLMKTLRAGGMSLVEIASELTARGIKRRQGEVGPRLRIETPEESGMNADLDRLADLLSERPPDRLDLFWSEAMAKQAPIDPSTISGQLRLAIRHSGETWTAISEASGVDSGIISRFMSGDRRPTLDTVDKLAAALGLRLCHDRDDAK
jgi:DNA-binding phage protein